VHLAVLSGLSIDPETTMAHVRPGLPGTFVRAVLLSLALPACAGAEEAVDPHAHHRMMMQQPNPVQRSVADYPLPAIRLVRQDGAAVTLADELNDGRAVFVDFIYTTCTTICPLSSQVFSSLQHKLGSERARVHIVSISIDPEQDTPARLREYAARFHAQAGWQHYTGTADASIATQRAFLVYRGDKMNHTPLTLFRPAPGKPWVRLEGFATADQLLAEYHGQRAGGP
jgi:protein SCO1/2